MRAGLNPTRRNRSIGTAKQGHGQDNELRIADPRSASGIYWSRLGSYRMIRRFCAGRDLPFFVENTRTECVHACSIADLTTMLDLVPSEHYATLAAVVLRQPKRKEGVIQPVWGRMIYWADVGRPQDGTASGPAIVLEALDPSRIHWRSKCRKQSNWSDSPKTVTV